MAWEKIQCTYQRRHLGLGLYVLYEGIKLHHSMLKEYYAGIYMIIRYIVGMRNTSYIDLGRYIPIARTFESHVLLSGILKSKHFVGDKIKK
jgi:hypothetical protein